MNTFNFGKSALDNPIFGYKFGFSGPEILILGGVHGNEPEGVIAAFGVLDSCLSSFTHGFQLTIVPIFNPDGVFHLKRTNGHQVDLNRNLPTKDWSAKIAKPDYHPGPFACSEPENQALVKWISSFKPQLIYSLHSWKPLLNVNGRCKKQAEVIQKFTGYKIEEDIGYPTPGCLGTYSGLERNIPTLTYEIERGLHSKQILSTHVPAIIESLKYSERNL